MRKFSAAELDDLVDSFVISLIFQGVWVTRAGLDLTVKETQFYHLSIMSTLYDFGFVESDCVLFYSKKDNKLLVRFSNLLEKQREVI